jgi:hypothetical protein
MKGEKHALSDLSVATFYCEGAYLATRKIIMEITMYAVTV